MLLACFGIALGCFASAVSLLTNNTVLEVFLLSLTYFEGILLVNVRRKYPILKKKNK
jgi:hypothetical protein